MLTEDEAKTKWCPYARLAGGQGMDGASYNRIEHYGGEISHTAATCIGTACMAWRWQAGTFEEYGRMMAKSKSGYVVVATGHCGLAGAPQ